MTVDDGLEPLTGGGLPDTPLGFISTELGAFQGVLGRLGLVGTLEGGWDPLAYCVLLLSEFGGFQGALGRPLLPAVAKGGLDPLSSCPLSSLFFREGGCQGALGKPGLPEAEDDLVPFSEELSLFFSSKEPGGFEGALGKPLIPPETPPAMGIFDPFTPCTLLSTAPGGFQGALGKFPLSAAAGFGGGIPLEKFVFDFSSSVAILNGVVIFKVGLGLAPLNAVSPF